LTRENHPEPWSQRVPLPEDLKDLGSLLENCDLNINMCSTMSLDFMLFDKPVINPTFGTGGNELYDDQKYLKYSHYKRVVESGAVAIVRNEDELLREINLSLKKPEARLKEQKELLKLQIGKPLEGTSERITEALKDITES
jgi:CDP-glycerol glycerophosphotransferase (TagB/SpsB family)